MSDRPDFTLPVSIEAITIATLPIDIKAQTLGVVKIDIGSQTLSQVDVNIKASAITMNVNIESQAVDLNINLVKQAYIKNYIYLLNAGFETGDFTGWIAWPTCEVGLGYAFTGEYGCKIVDTATYIEQVLEVPIEVKYIQACSFMLSQAFKIPPPTLTVTCTVFYTDGTWDVHDFVTSTLAWVNCDMLPYMDTTKALRTIRVQYKTGGIAPYLDDFILIAYLPTADVLATIDVDIVAQTMGNVAIDIAAQTVGNVNVNIAASAVTLNVNISSQGAFNLNVNIAASAITLNVHETGTANVAVTSSVQLDINIAASAITINVHETGTANVAITSSITLNMNITGSTINVPVTNPTGESLDVDIVSSITVNMSITGSTINVPVTTAEGQNVDVDIVSSITLNIAIQSSAVTLNVNIESQAVDINIKTSGGANIIIDKLTQTAYLERRSTLSNNGETASWSVETGVNRGGKFFPRGCRGFINTIDVYCKDAGAAGGTITVYISPHPNMGYVASANVTVGAGASADWRSATFNRMWNYDSLFIFILCSTADMHYGYDTGTPYDNFSSSDSGATWTTADNRRWFRVVMKGETVGDIPVSGTINTVQIPAATTKNSAADVAVPDGTTTSIVTINGAGELVEAKLNMTTVVAPAAAVVYRMIFYVDGSLAYSIENRDLTQSVTATSGRSSAGEFYQTAAATIMRVRVPLKFKRLLDVRLYQTTGAEVTTDGDIYANLIG